jgi:hypothetical protein
MNTTTRQLVRNLESAIAHAINNGYYDQAEQLQADLDYLRESK